MLFFLGSIIAFWGVSKPSFSMELTSVTLDAEDANGETLNAPGGVFSTNLADPVPQVGVQSNGIWLNTAWSGGELGEISITLKSGINTFDLFGSTNASLTGGYPNYGLVLFFDNIQTPPQIAIYNSNSGNEPYLVQTAGTQIISSANGGLWFDSAPGASAYHASDGSTVEVVEFSVSHIATNPDIIKWGQILPDGYPDIVGHLTLMYTPPPMIKIEEYPIPTPNSSPNDLVVDPFGNVWFTERDGKKIGRCSPSGVFKEYPVTYSDPFGIAYDQQTALVYFTEGDYGNGHYGVLNPLENTITEFSTGLPASSAVEGTLTPDGKFWFNGWDSQSVSRADKNGNIQNYIFPSFGYTSGLSEDSLGNLWLTKVGWNESNPTLVKFDTKLAQPNTSKGFAEIPLPYTQATIRRPICTLGKIWLPLMDQSKILSYDPENGTFKEYMTPTPDAGPQSLALDRWNRLWFAESAADKIGMLDLRTGFITEFAIPTEGGAPVEVAVDYNRDIVWFTESSGNKIGKLTLSYVERYQHIEGDFDTDGDVDGDDLSAFINNFGRTNFP